MATIEHITQRPLMERAWRAPQIGQRVRRTAPHDKISLGMLGTIDVVHENSKDFWVATDEGGFCGWTSFESWQPAEDPKQP